MKVNQTYTRLHAYKVRGFIGSLHAQVADDWLEADDQKWISTFAPTFITMETVRNAVC